MRFITTVSLMAGLLLVPAAYGQTTDNTVDAQAAAGKWLTLTDRASYADSWEQAAALFRGAISKPDWEHALHAVRDPLGAVKSRALKSAVFTRSLPGAPDGEYVVLQFDTQYEKKAVAVETVTPMKEPDGRWRVSGYFIK